MILKNPRKFASFFRDRNTLVFLIADVSGKGVPAALFMAVARTVLRDVLASGDSLSAAVERANTLLEKDSPGSMYVTLFAAAYDPVTGSLRYVNEYDHHVHSYLSPVRDRHPRRTHPRQEERPRFDVADGDLIVL